MRFNPADYKNREEKKEVKSYDPIPNGWYTAVIKDVTIKTWDNPAGVSIQLVWQVTEGKHKGRLHWQTLNVEHKDPSKELKARYMLSDVMTSVGYNDDIAWAEGKPPRQLVGYSCEIELITLAAQPPKFPKAKNWLANVRVPVPSDVQKSVVQEHMVSFDDDDVPF